MDTNTIVAEKLNTTVEKVQKGRGIAVWVLIAMLSLIICVGGFMAMARANMPKPAGEKPVSAQKAQVNPTPAVDCPLPEEIPGWNDKLSAKWYDLRLHCDLIVENANQLITPQLIAAVIMQESGGWAGAESSAGAIGLMQIMPSYHSCASWKPVRNIACGVNILTPLVLKYDLRGGLAAYNAGETGMSRGLGYDYADAVVAIFDKVGLSSELAMK